MTVAGEPEFRRAVTQLGPEAIQATKDVLLEAADEAVTRIRPHVPVDPENGGQLKASLRRTRPRFSKRSRRVTASVVAGGAKLDDDPARANVYPWAQEKGEAIIHGKARRFTHTVGQSPYMAVEVFKIGAAIPEKLMAALNKRAQKLGWSLR